MLATLTDLLIQNSQHAHWLIFSLLILAGFNFPISEDFMLIISGMLASTVIPENTFQLFFCVFLGCYLSDWIAYYLGRSLGPRLWQFPWFAKAVPRRMFCRLKVFYSKYGFLTLLVGRFIPFGVRNCLFITAGMTRMSFLRFIISDGIACLISNTCLFSLAYCFGKKYPLLLEYVRLYNVLIFTVFALLVLACALVFFSRFKYYPQARKA